jgi:hypothetical protein
MKSLISEKKQAQTKIVNYIKMTITCNSGGYFKSFYITTLLKIKVLIIKKNISMD